MPELPEVETIRRDLEREAHGRHIQSIVIDGARTVRRHDPALLVEGLAGRDIVDFRRKGKFLLADLDNKTTLVLHLRMSGQLLWHLDGDAPLAKHTHARIRFDDGAELRFVDPRTFGELWLTTPDVPELWHMGPDAVEELTLESFAGQLKRRKTGLKTTLLNQQVVAGIGNIYSDEILWTAKLRQDREPSSLSPQSTRRLYEAVGEVLAEGIEARGSSLADQQYVDLYGRTGGAQRKHKVYAREGEPCERCGTPITRIKIAGRSSFFCHRCQR